MANHQLRRPLKIGVKPGYDIAAAKRSVYRLLGRRDGKLWAFFVKMDQRRQKTYTRTFREHVKIAQRRLGVRADGILGQKTLDALYKKNAVDGISEHLFKLDRPSKVRPIPEGELLGIIGYPGQGTHNAWDWQSRNALDWKAEPYTKVFAPISGRIVRAGGTPGIRYVGGKIIFGQKCTIVPVAGGPACFLTHLSAMKVRDGDLVKAGDVIGVVGNWGPGSHLHCALEYGDPRAMLMWPQLEG